MNTLIALGSLSLVGAAAVLDSRSQRIPNWLSYGGLALGLCLQASSDGVEGLRFALSGAAVGGVLLLPLWLLGGLAAGDVKLMAAVGAYLGPAAAGFAALATLIAGGILAVAWIIHGRIAGDRSKSVRTMPYAPAIALGTGLTYFLAWFKAT